MRSRTRRLLPKHADPAADQTAGDGAIVAGEGPRHHQTGSEGKDHRQMERYEPGETGEGAEPSRAIALTTMAVSRLGSVVNAAGPWAGHLAASAGIALSMRTVREQDSIWEARPDRPLPTGSISNGVDAIYLRTLGDRRFVVGRGFPKAYHDVDPYNYKLSADEAFIADVQTRMERRFPPATLTRAVAVATASRSGRPSVANWRTGSSMVEPKMTSPACLTTG